LILAALGSAQAQTMRTCIASSSDPNYRCPEEHVTLTASTVRHYDSLPAVPKSALPQSIPTPPVLAAYPDLTPTIAAGAAISSTLDVLKANIGTVFVLEQNDAGKLTADDATLTGLQSQINTQAQTISQMQAQINALLAQQNPVTTLTWAGVPDGPYNGIQQGVNFGTGFWCVLSGELKACADGQPQRAFTFSKSVKIVSFTFSTTTGATTGIVLTGQPGGMTQTALAVGINQDTTFSPCWASTITSFTVGATPSTGATPDLRIRQVQYQ